MAGNVFQDGVWILDTASTTALLLGVTNDVRVKRIEWQPAAGADVLTMKDGAGDTKLTRTAVNASPSGDEVWEFDHKPLTFHSGVVLHTLTTTGKVYVYLAD